MLSTSSNTLVEALDSSKIHQWVKTSLNTKETNLFSVLGKKHAHSLFDFSYLISPLAEIYLENLAQRSQQITQQNFGKAISLFAPLYLSNECVNICKYCGFSRNNLIDRKTLSLETIENEVKILHAQNFRNILLVAGEHPKYVSNGYVQSAIQTCLPHTPNVSLELGPLPSYEYNKLVNAGAQKLIIYQETYHKPTYEDLHPKGPKKHYPWRLETPERAYSGGFRHIGMGALFGLYDWRYEAIALATHILFLLKNCWQINISISLPRLRPAEGTFQSNPSYHLSDKNLVQLICAFRWLFPQINIVLSTRENADLRKGLMHLGVTTMSAGSSTEPGGYSKKATSCGSTNKLTGEQFDVADERPAHIVAEAIRNEGYEAVWKDFDPSLILKKQPA